MSRRREPPKHPPSVFFIDRCLGRGDVVAALRLLGETVEVHDDHFAIDCPDEEWLREVARRGWAILTKDRRIRRRPAELTALIESNAAAFVLTAGSLSGPAMAAAFVAALPRMKRILENYTRPIIVLVSHGGETALRVGERRGARRKPDADRE